jgi:cystathionine beta-lyase/cystathionine gamma-synthase
MQKSFSTTLIRGGDPRGDPPPPPAPLTTPIYETTAFLFDTADEIRQYNEGHGGRFLYSRYENPTVMAVEATLAVADGADAGLVFSSGMAATSTVLFGLLRAGDEVVCGAAVYGGTRGLLESFLPRFGVTARMASTEELAAPEQLIGPKTKLLWFESPSNPTLRCVNVARIAQVCRAAGVVSVIDNTFASPANQRPITLGIDLVMQSATKYLGGHSDITAGVVCGAKAIVRDVEMVRRVLGGVLDPQPAYALGRSLKTLDVRVARHNVSAMAVASALEGHPAVARVYYPGLPSHPDHAIAKAQMSGFGGMVCIDLHGGEPAACQAFDRLQIVRRAPSLGGVESVCSLPILTSQWGYTDAQLASAGISRGMLRLSIGLEDAGDLIADLRQALE